MNTPDDASDTAINRLAELEAQPAEVIPLSPVAQVAAVVADASTSDPTLAILATGRSARAQRTIAQQRGDIERYAKAFHGKLSTDLLNYIELCLSSCYTEGWLEARS